MANMDELAESRARNFSLTSKEEGDVDVGSGSEGFHSGLATYDVVGRVVTERKYQAHTLQQNIDRVLRPVRGFRLQMVGDYRFVLQFNHPLDRTHALEGCPWLIDRCALLLTPIMEEDNPETMALDSMNIVVRLHNIPGAHRNTEVARKICSRIRETLEVIPHKGGFYQTYFRVRVSINITEPLARGSFLRMGDGSRKWVSFTYERLPVYCYLCGVVGHLERKCVLRFADNFIDPGKNFPYGEWLKVPTIGAPSNVTGSVLSPIPHSTADSHENIRRMGSQVCDIQPLRAGSDGDRRNSLPKENYAPIPTSSPNSTLVEYSVGRRSESTSRAILKPSQTKNRKKKAVDTVPNEDSRPLKQSFIGDLSDLVSIPMVAAQQPHQSS